MKTEIQKFWKGDIYDDEKTLALYSRDASIFQVRPALVLFPRDKEDVKNLVKWVGDNKDYYSLPINGGTSLAITARCAGTDMSGAAVGESIILDFTRYMNRLVGGPLPLDNSSTLLHPSGGTFRLQNYPAAVSFITVEPGMLYRDFEKITLSKGLILPCYTSSKNQNALGGMFGNNSAGERTLKYGQMENYVLSSKVIFFDGNEYEVRPLSMRELEAKMAQGDFEGNIYKKVFELIKENENEIKNAKPNVHKNSAGYYIWNVLQNNIFDLNKLLVGSQGTLGIVTEMTLKIIPENKYSRWVVVSLHDLEPLGRVVKEILTLAPDTLETYDDKSLRLAVRYFPDFLRRKKFLSWFAFLLNLLPEFWMMLRGSFPKLVILAEFRGSDLKDLEDKCQRMGQVLKDFPVTIRTTSGVSEAAKYWDIRHENFALLRNHSKGLRSAPFIDDVIVRPEFLPKFLPELKELLEKYKLTYAIAGHAGDGNFHIFPMLDFRKADTGKIILEIGDKVFDLVAKYQGSLAAEHNDGLIRTPYLSYMYTESILGIFRNVKEFFDPKNMFNPGKKVPTASEGGSKEYIASHMVKEEGMDDAV